MQSYRESPSRLEGADRGWGWKKFCRRESDWMNAVLLQVEAAIAAKIGIYRELLRTIGRYDCSSIDSKCVLCQGRRRRSMVLSSLRWHLPCNLKSA